MPDSERFNFNDFYKKWQERTVLFAKSYVHDPWVAEDIASEALIALWEIQKKNVIHHPRTFLFSIIRNKSIDYLRKELTKQETLAALSDVGLRELNTRIATLEAFDPEVIFSGEVKKILEETLNTLPPTTREVFIMSRFQERSRKEIAQTLGITSKGVEYHIGKALKQLRVNLKDYLPVSIFLFFFG